MAKFTSHVYAEIRGSTSGTVYSRNRFGAYTRRRVVPVQPRTEPQMRTRSRLTYIAQRWRTLTPQQQATWRTFAEQVTAFDSLGQPIRLTGIQAFVEYNLWRDTLGLALIELPPSLPPSAPQMPVGFTLVVSVNSGDVALNWTGTLAGTALVIKAAALQSMGVHFVGNSEFRTIHVAKPANFGQNLTGPIALGPAYLARWGSLLQDRNLWLQIIPADYTSLETAGFRGVPRTIFATVA